MGVVSELRRRNVFRMAVLYVVAAWAVMQAAEVLIGLANLPDWVGPTLLVVLAVGFPIALIISWFFEITPEGLALEKEVPAGQSITHVTGRRMDFVIIAILSAGLVLFAYDKWWIGPPPEKSIAVIPFTDLSETQDQGWFADGLAEEIINTLARTPDLLVSPRTSSFVYKGAQRPVPQIASELGVRYVLEGSVRRVRDQIRVTTQLIRAHDGFHIWSEHFDRGTEDIISIQEDIAFNVARALKTTMDPVELQKMLQAGTRSVEAYEHYLRGLASFGSWLETSDYSLIADALDHFDAARQLDPEFSAAHAQSANLWRGSYTVIRGRLADDLTPQQAFVKFRQAMIAAIDHAPDETQRMLLEGLLAIDELRITEAVRLLRRVLVKLPNSFEATRALMSAAIYASDEEALEQAVDKLLKLGDKAAIDVYLSAVIHLLPDDRHTAIVLEQVKRFPTSMEIIYQAHRAMLWAEEYEEAHKLYRRLMASGGSYGYAWTRESCSLNKREEVEEALNNMRQYGAPGKNQWHVLVLLGEHEAAAQALMEYDSEEVPLLLGSFLYYPQFDPRPFPVLMSALEREGIDRPPPRKIPFACPPRKDGQMVGQTQ
jgi:TolB-like protein